MDIWEKLISDPEAGPRTRSPLAFGVLGIGLSFLFFNTVITGDLQVSRYSQVPIHFSDHPITFVLSCIMALFGAVWGLVNSRKRYLMHDE